MTSGIVARRYAKALFDLEKRAGAKDLDRCGEDLARLSSLMAVSPDLTTVFHSPVFSGEEKHAVLKTVGEKAGIGSQVRNFCFLLADKGRLRYLPEITTAYQALLDVEKGILRGELVTAVPLSDEKRRSVHSELEKKAGRTLALEFNVDPAVLGGMVLKIGDKVLDASLRAQLSLLKDTIKRGE